MSNDESAKAQTLLDAWIGSEASAGFSWASGRSTKPAGPWIHPSQQDVGGVARRRRGPAVRALPERGWIMESREHVWIIFGCAVVLIRCHQHCPGPLSFRVPSRERRHGGLPEWPKGTVCKTVGFAYVGSNPTP